MPWYRNGYSKLQDNTTSHKYTTTFSTPSTSFNHTPKFSTSSTSPYQPTTSTSSSTHNDPSPDPPPPLREMWKCCQCNFIRNHYNPHKANHGAKCRKVFSNEEFKTRQQRGEEELNGCDHWGPCVDCSRHWEEY